jgi:hypothetical protein
MMWADVEPLRVQYNYSYIKTLWGIAKNATAYVIYTLFDMHQDAMSEKFLAHRRRPSRSQLTCDSFLACGNCWQIMCLLNYNPNVTLVRSYRCS